MSTRHNTPATTASREIQPTPTPLVRHADLVEEQIVAAGTATTTRVLIGASDGAENFFMRKFSMAENGGMPRHTNSVEHEQYVLCGRARIEIENTVYEIGKGDVVLIPAGVPHSYLVLEAPFEFLCLVPNRPDQIEIVDRDDPGC